MGDYDLGTARGTIEIDASTLARTASALDMVGNKMMLLGTLAIAGFGYAVKSAADFEQQLSRFGAASNATETQMESLRKKALQLGQDSAYGATEVVKAFAELAYAGATTKEIVSGLGDAVVYLAAAGEIPLADASTTLINTMRQFNIPAEKAVGIANELARAANASTVNIDDLNTSLRYVGPVAAAAGISFKSTAEALAVMGNEGIRGSTAGTSLRGILVSITKPSQQAAAKMQELGIITKDGANQFFTATGQLKSFRDIAQILQDTTKGLTKEQQLNAFGTIFQRRAMATAAVLAKEGAAGFDKLTASQQYNTTAQEIMKKKLDNLKGSFKILKASVETAAITIGELFTPYLKTAADAIRDAVNWFSKLPSPVKKAVGLVLVLGGGFLFLGGAISKIMAMSTRAYKAFIDLGKALKLLTAAEEGSSAAFAANPIGLVVIAVIALAVAAYFLWTNWDKVWTWIKEHKAYAAILALIFPFIAMFVAVVGALKYLYDNWDKIWPKLKAIAKDVLGWLTGAWDDVKQAFNDAVDWVGQAIDDIISFFKKLPGNIKRWLTQAAKDVSDWLKHLPEHVAAALSFIIEAFVKLGLAIINGLVEGFKVALPAVTSFFLELPATILSVLGDVAIWLLNAGFAVIQGLLDGIFATIDQLWAIFTEMPGRILSIVADAGSWLISTGNMLIQGLWDGAWAVFMGLLGWLAGFAGSFITAIGNLLGTLLQAGKDLLQGLWNGAFAIWVALLGWLQGLPSQMFNALAGLASTFYNTGIEAMQGLWNGLIDLSKSVIDWVGNFVGNMVDKITSALDIGSPSRRLHRIGKYAMEGLLEGLKSKGPASLLYMGQLANDLTAAPSLAAASMAMPSGTSPSVSTTDSRQTIVNQDITIQAVNPEELARKLTAERDWALRTAKVA